MGLFSAIDGAAALLVVALISLFFKGGEFFAGFFIFLALVALAQARREAEANEEAPAPPEPAETPPAP